MSAKKIRIGIIGADTKASWAGVSHVPAITGLAGVTLAAVATRHEESARNAAATFGVERWFADPFAMIGDDGIDLVTVAVKVPAHRDLVLAALAAGKAVYCEAPLGCSLEETETLALQAKSAHTAIGLQARFNPSVRRAADLVRDGKIGRPLNARVVSTTSGMGPVTLSAYTYFEKASSGANLLTITSAHTLDAVEAILGEITEVEAVAPTLWPSVLVHDTGEHIVREVPDHADILGRTTSGAVFSADIMGGVAPDQGVFTFDLRGTEGWLRLSGGHPYGFQAGDLTLTSSAGFAAADVPAVSGGLEGAAINVGELYAVLARDIATGTHASPDFNHALHSSRLASAIARASAEGRRQTVPAGA